MPESEKKQVAIVTGAGNGIGQGIAKRLAREGIAVIIADVDKEGSDETVREILDAGGAAAAVKCDISKVADIYAAFDFCSETFGTPDIFVANAAINFVKPMEQITEEDYYKVTDVNFKGTLFCIKAAGERLNDGGRIVALSSSSTVYPVEGMSIYTGTKAAIKAMVAVAALELAPRGITVNSVMPGVTPTKRMDLPEEFRKFAAEATPFKRLGTPDDIAEIVAFLAGKSSQWVTGQSLLANGGSKF
ncbi:MAG: SDR family oxidoreductase [Clostridiales bacterium]|nr:SDR family oxidoreductase [Clostridiales bacterium]